MCIIRASSSEERPFDSLCCAVVRCAVVWCAVLCCCRYPYDYVLEQAKVAAQQAATTTLAVHDMCVCVHSCHPLLS